MNRRIFLFTVFLLFIAVVSYFFYQSDIYKKKADTLVKDGNPQEAIVLYQKAKSIFPLRNDIDEDIRGAELVIKSDNDYRQIVSFEEFQEIPPLSNLPQVSLAPNQFFVPILMYHHIRVNPIPNDPIFAALNVTARQLDFQLNFLSANKYHTVNLDDLSDALAGKKALPSNPIVLTFDDSYRDFYTNAFPLLKKYHVKAVQFVITQVLNTPDYLTWDEITEMDKSGLVEFGAHTRHHPNLPDISTTNIVNEILGSKSDLESHLGKKINWFAYPYGSYNSFIVQTVKDAGFKGAVSTIYGPVQSASTVYLAPRIMIDGRFSIEEIARRIEK